METFILTIRMGVIKYSFFAAILVSGSASLVSAQKISTILPVRYTQTVEANRMSDGKYNVANKSDEERLLFGDFNAPLEFVLVPSFGGMSGVRIYRDSTGGGWLLETKRIVNWQEVNDSICRLYPEDRTVRNLTLEQWERTREEKRERQEKKRRERLALFRIETHRVPINDTVMSLLYPKTRTLVENSTAGPREMLKQPKGTGVEIVGIIKDGDMVIFRYADDDRLGTLRYHEPEGEVKALADLFRAMIVDVGAGVFDEAAYLDALK